MKYLIYCGYIFFSSLLTYPLLKWKGQHPTTLDKFVGMVFFNALICGLLPIAPLLMKSPPDKRQRTSFEYYDVGKIWIWNK